ncbi:MAG TPA: GAF domain-containing protein [Methylomirabilota bacterium]|nr:GAF domain-containing protein [Methylomirabilota bacterium]
MANANELKDFTGSWESLLVLWDRAKLLRAFMWHHQCPDQKALLSQFLVRLRRFYGVDYCFGGLLTGGGRLIDAAVPEAGLDRLPGTFARRCLDLIAHSRAPIVWNDVSGEFGFRSTVVVPVIPPVGETLGFLMLGHAQRRSYSVVELFLLQSLASELSWVARDLNSKKEYHEQHSKLTHDISNVLQLIAGNSALIRHKLAAKLDDDQERYFSLIESNIEGILQRMNRAPVKAAAREQIFTGNEMTINIVSAVEEAIESCQQVRKERGVDVKIFSTPTAPEKITAQPAMFKRILHALVHDAVSVTRNDTIECSVRGNDVRLELAVKGKVMNRVAEKVNSLFESETRGPEVSDDSRHAIFLARKYLASVGGDTYLKDQPGEASEFIIYMPVGGNREVKPNSNA